MNNIVRYPDWEDRLSHYLGRVEDEPFAWGTHDCALFAAGCVNAQTGVDPAAAFRGTYDSRVGAAEALRDKGQGTLLKTVKGWFGEPVAVPFAKRGDLVMRDTSERDRALGVCTGLYSWFVGEEQGQQRLVPVPTAECRYAFSVPFEASA